MNKSLFLRFLASIFCLAIACIVDVCVAQSEGADSPQEILITGERPGPGLWKISKDGHHVWLMGIYAPLPKKLLWQSRQVLELLGQSQVFIYGPAYLADVSFFKEAAIAKAANRNPDGAGLQTILPAASYARWSVLRDKYHLSSGAEKLRPLVAIAQLRNAAAHAEGLEGDAQVMQLLEATAKRKKPKTIRPVLKVKLENADETIASLNAINSNESGCFDKKLDELESHLHELREFANAWAMGDLAGWRNTYAALVEDSCASEFAEYRVFATMFGAQFQERGLDEWFKAVDSALQENASSFAVLPISMMLRSDELVLRMKQAGWEVMSPVSGQEFQSLTGLSK